MKNRKFEAIIATVMMVFVLFAVFVFSDDKELQKEVVQEITNTVTDIATYEMTEKEVKELPSTEIIEQTEQQENAQEQEVEDEGFQLQGEIAYEGDKARSWNVELGDYKGLTYYSQIDSRWSSKMYSSVGNSTQTVGSSGCGPTSAAMVVTATKGAITPDTMSDLFVKYGYRSSNNGTYWSAFRAVADEFNIGYTETTDIQRALQLLKSNHYVVASCGNGLFTTGGHFIVLVGIDGDTIQIYDPYLYSGKFETSTRRGKVTVSGNTVYCSASNFINYANAQGFFCYSHDGNVTVNNSNIITTSTYTRYVNAKSGLNVRNAPEGNRIGGLSNGTSVSVTETRGNWSRIVSPINGWVSSSYLSSYTNTTATKMKNTVGITKKLSRASTLYSNRNLTGIKYNYKANTTITILQNIASTIDKVRVNQTGRIAYINNSNYSNIAISNSKNTMVGQYRRFKNATILYSNSNLTGTKYNYWPLTQVKIIRNVSPNIDYVYVVKTGRYAYVNSNNY